MQVVFMNTLTKGEGQAQLWIGEEEGAWHLGWREFEMNGETNDFTWYEGASWNEMIYVYRHQLAEKLGEGYRPFIEGIFHEEDRSGRSTIMQKLLCYSELNPREELYAELSTWRRKKAASERKAPYIIASNRVLRMISSFVPQNVQELLQLPGVGETKATEYGPEILEITGKHERVHAFPLTWVEEALSEDAYLAWTFKQREEKYKQQLEQYRLSRRLLQGIADGKNLVQLEQECGRGRKELLEVLEALEKEGYNVDQLITLELQDMPEEEQLAVWDCYTELGDSFLKPVLQRVYGQDHAAIDDLDQAYERLRMIRIRYRRSQEKEKHAG